MGIIIKILLFPFWIMGFIACFFASCFLAIFSPKAAKNFMLFLLIAFFGVRGGKNKGRE